MKKECALCTEAAKVYCESDESNLCWRCDWKIHSANFLVAKHCRCLLCHLCQSPTQWKASGEKIGSTLSVCQNCLHNKYKHRLQRNHQNQEQESEETGDTENQVVPWSSGSTPCSTSDPQSSSAEFADSSSKRMRGEDDSKFQEDDLLCCSSSSQQHTETETETETETCLESLRRPLKMRKLEDSILSGLKDSESNVLVNSLKRFHQELILSAT